MVNNIPFPPPEDLPGTQTHAPYVLVGDEAFPSKLHLLKPYSKKSKAVSEKTHAVFNYRLSRAQICVECSFGILTSRFRFLLRRMTLSPNIAMTVVKASCVLHNFLVKDNNPFVQAAIQRQNMKLKLVHARETGLLPFPNLPGYHTSTEARQVCNIFTTYFRSKEGFVPWQDKCAHISDLKD